MLKPKGITSTDSLGHTNYGGGIFSRKKNKQVKFPEDAPEVQQASANLSNRLTSREKKCVKFNEFGVGAVFEDANVYYIPLWTGLWREQYEKDENGNLYSGKRGKGHLTKKRVVYRYPHMINVPVEQHINCGNLDIYYERGFCLEEDMPNYV